MRDLTCTVLWRTEEVKVKAKPTRGARCVFCALTWGNLLIALFSSGLVQSADSLKWNVLAQNKAHRAKDVCRGTTNAFSKSAPKGKDPQSASSESVYFVNLPILILHFLQKTRNPHPLFAQNGANSRHSSPIYREFQHCLGHDFPLIFTLRTNSWHPGTSRSIALIAPALTFHNHPSNLKYNQNSSRLPKTTFTLR